MLDPRPHVLTIVGGKNIRIRDVRIGNSAYWTIHLAGCNDVVISGITLLNSLKVRNSDGIDVDHSKNVRISDCYIESGDDCICLKNRREYEEFGRCENITVSNCTMTSRSCAIKMGSENMDTIRQVVFNNCIIKNSNREWVSKTVMKAWCMTSFFQTCSLKAIYFQMYGGARPNPFM